MKHNSASLIFLSVLTAFNANAQSTAWEYNPSSQPASAPVAAAASTPTLTVPISAAVYKLNGDAPLWTGSRQNESRAADFMNFLPQIRRHGLLPQDYKFNALYSQRKSDPQFETRFTNEIVRLATHVAVGRVTPSTVSTDIHFDRRAFNNSNGVFRFITNISNQTFDAIAPQHARYLSLMPILQKLREVNARGGFTGLKPVATELTRGVSDPIVVEIKRRLNAMGFGLIEDSRYDAETFQAMKEVQRASLVEDTGNLNPRSKGTWAYFAVDSFTRQQEVELTMEKLRWLPENLGQRYIMVNIANQEVQVVDPDLESTSPVRLRKAIVGKDNHRTPTMPDRVVNVALNPKWRVTENILKNELVPKLLNAFNATGIDGVLAYLDRTNMRLVDRNDRSVEIDPTTLDWTTINRTNIPFMIVQDSGTDNALGVVKINLANKFAIYMHDTDDRSLFARFKRLLSHGCIRIQNPLELAAYLLEGSRAPYTLDQLEGEVSTVGNAKEERIVPIAQARRMPVYIMPLTVYSRNNHATFTPDAYNQNRALLNSLTRNGFYVPENTLIGGQAE